MRPAHVFTWHVHGSYLYYLAHAHQEFFVPVKPGRPPGYAGLPPGPFPWPPNLHEVPVEDISDLQLDCVLFQWASHYVQDQHEVLAPAQQRLPKVFLEHDPPRESPTDTRHVVDDPNVLLVHVTPFNALMWDSSQTPTRVVEHGVTVPSGVRYSGELARGIVVVNHLARRGRRLGADLFEAARQQVPLDLVGMGAEEMDGLGEVPHDQLPAFAARYRFFFNPIRYTSLGLAVCEAMMAGLPIVGFATTEMATAVENGVSGYIDTDPGRLVAYMRELLADPAEARRLGEGAARRARERFGLERFVRDWDDVFATVTDTGGRRRSSAASGGVRETGDLAPSGSAEPRSDPVLSGSRRSNGRDA